MSEDQNNVDPYRSARDLPSFVEQQKLLTSFGVLTRFVAREQRSQVEQLRAQLDRIASAVDGFYDLLGSRHWIFHDQMSIEMVQTLLELRPTEAERAFIGHYRDPEVLARYVRSLRRFPGLRARMNLIERARDHYEAERYDATVLTLIPVMDGFVNDVNPAERRGLHTREAEEMAAWDSVVGHHLGLSNAHRTFTKSFRKTSDEPVHELFRHGIVHGMLTNFDNDIVATKAWNRLFAVVDWGTARENQFKEPEPEPSLMETLSRYREIESDKQALSAFVPQTLESGDACFGEHPLVDASSQYLDAWSRRNYGAIAEMITANMREKTHGKTAGRAREEFEPFPLEEFSITKIHHQAAAAGEVDVTLIIEGEQQLGRMRWIREGADGYAVSPNREGVWRLVLWEPFAILNRREDPAE